MISSNIFSGLAALCLLPVVISESPAATCKCSPDDDCWPSTDDWDGLNTTLSGRLIQTRPPAAVCYSDEPEYDTSACEEVLSRWHLSTFHSSDPSSISYQFWADNPCPPVFPNGTSIGGDPGAGERGCGLGRYPSYVVNATGAEDIAAAMRWAAEHDLRVNIKNTGHSHLGRSTAYGSLSIWMHNIRGIDFHDNFQSETCRSGGNGTQMAATIGAGEVDLDVYTALHEHEAVIVGGANPSVGIVGWFTGGGHGFLSSTYGMGADNVLEATLVTPGGDVVTANACSHPDLFYAIRGGGGGTYGVVTSVVMKAYPTPRTTNWDLTVALLDPSAEDQFWDAVAVFHAHLARLKEGGVQGYYYVFGPPMAESLTLVGFFMLFDKPEGTVSRVFEPLAKSLDEWNGTLAYVSNEATVDSYLEAYGGDVEREPVAQNIAMGSRLLPAEALEDVELLSRTFREITGSLAGGVGMVGHLIAHSGNKDLDIGMNPAWRDTVAHFVAGRGWPDGTSAEEVEAIRALVTHNITGALRKLAPDSGAYFNEMDPFEPNWQYAAFGSNYARLMVIKDKYDPEAVLWCRGCVGSELWVEDDAGRLCRPDWWDVAAGGAGL